MASATPLHSALPIRPPPTPAVKDLWAEALKSLSAEDQELFKGSGSNILGLLHDIRTDTENQKTVCESRGWRVGRNKNGDEVKLRHVLEKISVWVNEFIKIVDVGVSFDASGHAAAPWALVKYLLTAGISDIAVFASVAEGVESVSGLITRYTIIERLYVRQDCDATPHLIESIAKLYAAMLQYLSKASAYFRGNAWQRFGRSLLEMITKQFEELKAKISEVDVEKWVRLVDAEVQQKTERDISEYHQSLMAALNRLNQPIMLITDQISAIHDMFTRDERREIFKWMSEIEYKSHHDAISKGLLPNSGRWLLESPEFIDWGQSNISSILWLHGIAGSGKSRLASAVINYIKACSTSQTCPLAFFYCSRSAAEPDRAKPVQVLRALVRQLASSKSDLPIKEPLAKEYESRKKEAEDDCSKIKELTVDDCVRLILQLVEKSPATIVVDALDECEEDTRHELLEAFDTIISGSEEVVKVFVSSRDDVDIELHLQDSRNLSLSATKNKHDIARFVDFEVNRLIKSKLLLNGTVSSKLKDKVTLTLKEQANGMFRWVELSLERLQSIKGLPDFKEALGKLPPKLSGLYDVIYADILQTETNGRKVALATFNWLLCARRLMSLKELIAALSLENEVSVDFSIISNMTYEEEGGEEEDNEDYEEEAYPSQTDILRVCHNLVLFDSELKVLRFAHQSVQEYLQNLPEFSITTQHAVATERCLDMYLYRTWPSGVPAPLLWQSNGFTSYAMWHWPLHFKYIDEYLEKDSLRNLKEKIDPFMLEGPETSPAYANWAADVREAMVSKDDSNGRNKRKDDWRRLFLSTLSPPTPLAAACAFGFKVLMRSLLLNVNDFDWNQLWYTYRGGSFALMHMAAQEGHENIIGVLLEQNANVNILNNKNATPMLFAARNGYESTVKLLFEKGANPDISDSTARTPLYWAVSNKNESMVRLLLEKNVDPNISDSKGYTPLCWAVIKGNESIARLLLEKNADPNISASDGWTPLYWAVINKNESMVRLLLEKNADPNISASDGWTPLYWAVYNENESIARLLLEKNADPSISDSDGWTPLYRAVINKDQSIVRLLLEKSADPTTETKSGISPLSRARQSLAQARKKGYPDGVRKFENIVKMCEDKVCEMSGEENEQQLLDNS